MEGAPRRTPPDEVSAFAAVLPLFSSLGFEASFALPASCVPPFMGPSTVLATLVSWVTKLALSPGEIGRDLAEEGEAALGDGDVGLSSRTSKCAFSSLTPRQPFVDFSALFLFGG